MCELLVQIADACDDPTRGLPRMGDVIVVEDDGHAWGDAELKGRLLLHRPGTPKEDMAHLLGRMVPEGFSPLYRAFYLDVMTMETIRREPVPMVLGDTP